MRSAPDGQLVVFDTSSAQYHVTDFIRIGSTTRRVGRYRVGASVSLFSRVGKRNSKKTDLFLIAFIAAPSHPPPPDRRLFASPRAEADRRRGSLPYLVFRRPSDRSVSVVSGGFRPETRRVNELDRRSVGDGRCAFEAARAPPERPSDTASNRYRAPGLPSGNR